MKLILQHRHHQPSASLIALLHEQLKAIGEIRQIDEARILIERRHEDSPPFRIAAHLVTPGPDLFAEAVEHTLRAALQKIVSQIEAELARRMQKRTRNLRSALSRPASTPPPLPRALVAAR